jgi:Peptidase family C25
MAVTEVRRRETGDTAAQQTIVEQLNAGATLVTYTGHGSYEFWRGDLLTAAVAADLTNRERLSVVAAVACLNGYFQDPTRETLAEALLLADGGGAVAVWTSSGMTYAPGQAALLEAWAGVLFAGDTGDQSLTLGEAAVRAKAATDDRDVRRTWNFFGDPSMRLVK